MPRASTKDFDVRYVRKRGDKRTREQMFNDASGIKPNWRRRALRAEKALGKLEARYMTLLHTGPEALAGVRKVLIKAGMPC